MKGVIDMFRGFIRYLILFIYVQIIGRFIGMVGDLFKDFIRNKKRQEPPKGLGGN